MYVHSNLHVPTSLLLAIITVLKSFFFKFVNNVINHLSVGCVYWCVFMCVYMCYKYLSKIAFPVTLKSYTWLQKIFDFRCTYFLSHHCQSAQSINQGLLLLSNLPVSNRIGLSACQSWSQTAQRRRPMNRRGEGRWGGAERLFPRLLKSRPFSSVGNWENSGTIGRSRRCTLLWWRMIAFILLRVEAWARPSLRLNSDVFWAKSSRVSGMSLASTGMFPFF